MATQKYFLVTHTGTLQETLVRAPRDTLAISVVAGDAAAVRQATDDDIAKFEGKLHARSVELGSGKYFVVGDQIIRAKNPATAYALVNQDTFTAKLLNQDELVACLNKQLKPISYVAPSRPDKTDSKASSDSSSEGGPATPTPAQTPTPLPTPTPAPSAESEGGSSEAAATASNDDSAQQPAFAAAVGG